jgi:hypothetical protein
VLHKQVIEVSDKLYLVLRRVKIDNRPIVDAWKTHLQSDIVFKKEPFYYFCKSIIDVEPID